MAKTKQRVHKNAMKTVDLSKEKVPAPVKAMIRRVDQSIAQQIKDANIPAFTVLANTTNIGTYFTHYNDYSRMLGDAAKLMERIVMTSICSVLAEDIYEQMSKVHGYVGVWDKYTIYELIASTITIMKADWTEEYFLTAQQYTEISKEDFANLPEGSCMAFSLYSPQAFFTIVDHIHTMALVYITNMMKARIPKLFAATKELPVDLNLANMFRVAMAPTMSDYHKALSPINEYRNSTNTASYLYANAAENNIYKFTEAFEKPFLALVVTYLTEGGLSSTVIEQMLEMSRIHIIFDDPIGKKFGEINIQYSIAPDNLKTENPPERVMFGFSIQDVMDYLMYEGEEYPKSRKSALGKSLRKYILLLITYALNVDMAVHAPKPVEEKVEEVIGEIDADDVYKLLEDSEN